MWLYFNQVTTNDKYVQVVKSQAKGPISLMANVWPCIVPVDYLSGLATLTPPRKTATDTHIH